ncbi:MAG: restriction endonuclease [Clostridiales bacterium]|nr:restriction endonuclease [Clostridiales bacterium]
MARKKQPTYRHKKLATFSFFSLLILVVGVILAVVYLTMFKGQTNMGSVILMWASIGLLALGFILTLICIVLFRIADLRDKKRKDEMLDNFVAETAGLEEEQPPVEHHADSADEQDPAPAPAPVQNAPVGTYIVDASNVTYIPSKEAYDFVMMGQYQTLEQKFEEIGKMDKTQFVIYVARLFSRKGYQVKLTPVVDNHDIDLLVEKMGVTIAVGCILTNKVLCRDDIVCVKNGRSYYGVNNSMALTNMYFDRTALDYAKEEHMSLVDRNVLAEDFMV